MSAHSILFEELYRGKPLFRSQLELVSAMLQHPESPYYLQPELSADEKGRAQGRLRTYISQLLSPSATRTVTDHFRHALFLVLKDRVSTSEELTEMYGFVVKQIEEKNRSVARSEPRVPDTPRQALKVEMERAHYIAFISAVPLNMDSFQDRQTFSVKEFFLTNLLANLHTETSEQKHYRFNFPMESYCHLFWSSMEKILQMYLEKAVDSHEFMQVVYRVKHAIGDQTFEKYKQYRSLRLYQGAPRDLDYSKRLVIATVASNILELLNRHRHLCVFYLDAPVYSVPMVVTNPHEASAQVFGIIDTDSAKELFFKYNRENLLLWRIFVWDKIKSDKKGINIPYRRNDYSGTGS